MLVTRNSILAAAAMLLCAINAAPPPHAHPAGPPAIKTAGPGPPGGCAPAPTAVPGSPGCPPPIVPPRPEVGLPSTCYTKRDGSGHITGGVVGPDCFTYTTTAPAVTCPLIQCEAPSSDQICPLYLKVSSTTVPCATDCCPFTPTATYSCGPCPTCDPCRIPTELTIFTTGCPGGGVQSSVTVVTPAF